MKKNIFLFVLVAALSFLFFNLFDSYTQAENLVPTPEANSLPEPAKPEPKPDLAPPSEVPEVPIVIDTTIYTKDKDGYYEITWKHLSKVEFNEVLVDSIDSYVPFPVFHPEIKFLEGKKIKIKGYVIPISETGDDKILVLSAFPFTQCFFCGNAGPESVMDIKLKNPEKKRYKQDDVHTFKGKLRLNDSDLYYLNYILENAL